jgi:hypothetical protein
MIDLGCYINGEADVFLVSISPDSYIDDLKMSIHNKGSSSAFVGWDHIDLTLTKVRYIMVSV